MTQPKIAAVMMQVTCPDGSLQPVRVGTAFATEQGWSIQLLPLTIGELAEQPLAAPAAKTSDTADTANVAHLEYYAQRARARLADPRKSRWHDSDRHLLSEIEAELDRLRGRLREHAPAA